MRRQRRSAATRQQRAEAHVELAPDEHHEAIELALADAELREEDAPRLGRDLLAGRADAARERDAVNAVEDGELLDRETVGVVLPEEVPLPNRQRLRGFTKRQRELAKKKKQDEKAAKKAARSPKDGRPGGDDPAAGESSTGKQ